MPNFRRTLAIKIATPGGDNPLLVKLAGGGPFYRGIPVSGLALVGQGGTPAYAFSIIAGSLPTGLSLNALTGAITGTPSASGHFPFVAKIQDADSNVFAARFSLDIRSQLFVVAGTPNPGENLLPYSYQMVVRDGSGATVTSGFTVAQGNLPDGLTISTGGRISGTPTFAAIGFSYATVNVNTGLDSLDIPIVIQVFSPLLFFGTTSWRLFAGIRFEILGLTVFPSGGAHPYQYQWDNLADYPWLHFDYNTKTFSGTPDGANVGFEQTVTGTVRDALGATGVVEFSFTQIFALASVDGVVAIGPDGNVPLISSNNSILINPTTAGELDLTTALSPGGDGVQSVNGIFPDSSGNVDVATGGITNINGVFPDSGGGVSIGSGDGSIDVGIDSNGDIDLSVAGGSSQAGIQYQDEGSNLGTSGTVTTSNAVGPGVTRTRVGNVITDTIPGGAVNLGIHYGSGFDGSPVFDGTNTFTAFANLVSGVYILSRDVAFDNVTISGTASIATNGSRIFIKGTLTVTSSAPFAINLGNGNGQNATNNNGAGGGGANARASLGIGAIGDSGRGGGTAAGQAAIGGTAVQFPALGGGGGGGGRGGAGASGAGGAAAAGANQTTSFSPYESPSGNIYAINSSGTGINIFGASGGGGGAGGGGDGTAGGGGGGGGSGGGIMFIACRYLNGTFSISVKGGNGGNGFTPVAGNRGGGGGGAGGGGGGLVFLHEAVTSGTVTLNASGGTGGNGGTGSGTGASGSGGGGGAGGFVIAFNTLTGAVTANRGTLVGLTSAGAGVTTGVTGQSCNIVL